MKVLYGITIKSIKNGMYQMGRTHFRYESDIVSVTPNSNTQEAEALRNEVFDFFKDKFENYDSLMIEAIAPAHEFLNNEFRGNIPQQYAEVAKESQELWEKVADEVSRQWEIQLMSNSIEQVNSIIEKAKELNMLDSQEFLNYLDTLNKLSIDPDRK